MANGIAIVGEFMHDGIRLRNIYQLIGACVMAHILGFGLRSFIIWHDLSFR